MGQCLHCQKELPSRATKPRKYCDQACRQADYRARESARAHEPCTEHMTRIHELEAENARLQARLNVEYLYRMDTDARYFKAWLRKQRTYPQGSFAHRFLADTSLPQQASRAMFEAQLRRLRYSDEDIEAFRDYWRAMLLHS